MTERPRTTSSSLIAEAEAFADPVVITGTGLASCLGLNVAETWAGVAQGRCGIGALTALEQPGAAPRGGGQAPELPAAFHPDAPREVRYLRWVAREALAQAHLHAGRQAEPRKVGLILGTTLHGMRAGGRFLRSGDPLELRTFLAGSAVHSLVADLPPLRLAATTCSACSSALASVGVAITLLASRQFDVVIAGGYDTVSEYVYAGFNSLRLVAEGPLRPFATDRQGMKVAEGYGLLVLERASEAARRGATILGTLRGFGESSDTHHLTQPHPEGHGAAAAIAAALASARLSPREIGLIACHATGTPDNDAAEYQALRRVFGPALRDAWVAGLKGHLGHTLGGAGAVELILALTAMRRQQVPPTPNVSDETCAYADLRLHSGAAPLDAPIRATLNMSLGFGGSNTCIVLSGPPAPPVAEESGREASPRVARVRASAPPRLREVWVTGVGVLLPEAAGNGALLELLARDIPGRGEAIHEISEAQMEPWLSARRTRRMSHYARYTLAAAAMAMQDAGLAGDMTFGHRASAILGTTHAAPDYCERYYSQVVREGVEAANPLLFAEGVPNVAAAHLSMTFQIRGGCQTILGTRTAGLDALHLAATRIRSGEWERAIVSAAEESTPTVSRVYQACLARGCEGGTEEEIAAARGYRSSPGAVTLILESRASAEGRGAAPRGTLEAGCSLATLHRAGGSGARRMQNVLSELGRPTHLLGASTGTVLDRFEHAAIDAALRPADQPVLPRYASLYPLTGDTCSVGPLLALAAVLLTGRMPPYGGQLPVRAGLIEPALGDETVDRGMVISSDWSGLVSAVRFACGPHRRG